MPRHRTVETVIYVRDGNVLTLGKKLVRQGKGLYNGFGGGVKPWETIETAAVRELLEETGGKVSKGIIPLEMRLCGVIRKYKGLKRGVLLYFFMVTTSIGEAVETDEMIPEEFKISDPCKIPYENMHSGDEILLPLFLANKKVIGCLYYDNKGNLMCEDIEEVDEIPCFINF